jgi:hypothetical protein
MKRRGADAWPIVPKEAFSTSGSAAAPAVVEPDGAGWAPPTITVGIAPGMCAICSPTGP